jgi:hypothetical protein
MHSASIPIFVRMNNMLVWLDEAEAHARTRKTCHLECSRAVVRGAQAWACRSTPRERILGSAATTRRREGSAP